MIKNNIGRIIAAIFILVLAFGIGATYERYRGTDLSRAPSIRRVNADSSNNGFALANVFANSSEATTAFTNANGDGQSIAENVVDKRASGPIEGLRGTTDELLLYPSITKGMRTPFDLYRYYGRGRSSFGSPVLPMRFEQWLSFHRKQKPKLMSDVHDYMNGRFDFSGKAIPGHYMSGGKPIMQGPVSRLPNGFTTFEQLASLSPQEIREQDAFPFKPLAHPLQSVAHMVFPPSWIKAHPEHARIDVDMDILS